MTLDAAKLEEMQKYLEGTDEAIRFEFSRMDSLTGMRIYEIGGCYVEPILELLNNAKELLELAKDGLKWRELTSDKIGLVLKDKSHD